MFNPGREVNFLTKILLIMKKLMLPVIMAIVFLVSCQSTIDKEKKAQIEAENKAIVSSLRTVEFNGHSYIVYREGFGTKNFGGITHDPDCGCEEMEYYGVEVIKYCSCEEDDLIQ